MSTIHDALKKASKHRNPKTTRESRSGAPVEISIPPSFDNAPKTMESGPAADAMMPAESGRTNPWIVWVATGLAVAGLFASVLLFVAKEGERKLRKDAEGQLSAVLEELAMAQTRFSDLAREKTELEEQFYANVAEFEKTVKEYDEKIGRLAERARRIAVLSKSLRREGRTLRDTTLSKDRTIEQLMGQVGGETAPAAAEAGSS
ncbi:MAG: hypothetical protein ACREH5_00280 [Candidatus Omnitrophota bacterium]